MIIIDQPSISNILRFSRPIPSDNGSQPTTIANHQPVSAKLQLGKYWSLIMGRGATKWKNSRSETLCTRPPPSRYGKAFYPPPSPFLMGGNMLYLPAVWLKLLKLPQNFLCPPPLHSLPRPPSPFCSLPPPLPPRGGGTHPGFGYPLQNGLPEL